MLLRFLLVALLISAGGAATAAERAALVIGVGDYEAPIPDLANPVNDAKALDAALSALDFHVTRIDNPDTQSFRDAVAAFEAEAADASLALVFFAGHGVQISGENHLLGADLRSLTLEDVRERSVWLSSLRAALQRAAPDLGIIVLDACRDNPLAASGLTPRGLATAQGGSRLLIAYSTDPGNVALDGGGANSPFTEALVEHVATPGLDVRLMFGRVRQQVVRETRGRQVPWVEEAVLGEVYLNPDPPLVRDDAPMQVEVDAWEIAVSMGDVEAYERYIDRYPDGLFLQVAKDRIAAMSEVGARPVEVRLPEIEAGWTDLDKLRAALITLGALHGSDEAATSEELLAALRRYASQTAMTGDVGLGEIYRDAFQVLVSVGAKTAQRMRTDLVALEAMEHALDSAEAAFAQLERAAQTDETAAALLPQAEADLKAIREARERVLLRLDGSRTHYAEMIQRAADYFGPNLDQALVGLESGTIAGVDVDRNSTAFIHHADDLRSATFRGSYSWIADFLPQA